jgi:hypothetical protein
MVSSRLDLVVVNMKTVYYRVRKNSEAYKAIKQFQDDIRLQRKYRKILLETYGMDTEMEFVGRDGSVIAGRCDKKPEGFANFKRERGYYYPKVSNKAARKMWDDQAKLGPEEFALRLFNKSPFNIEGLSMRRGAGFEEIGGVFYVDHAEDGKVSPKVKGLSEVEEWQVVKAKSKEKPND